MAGGKHAEDKGFHLGCAAPIKTEKHAQENILLML